MQLTSVIFDIDGLLIDSEPLWNEAASEVFATYGVSLPTNNTKALPACVRENLYSGGWPGSKSTLLNNYGQKKRSFHLYLIKLSAKDG